jgi:addiction module HigA family antidote
MVVDYLEAYEWSQSDVARRTGLTPKTISSICNSKAPITPTTALALEKVFQRPAHFWLNLQRQFDEAEARARNLTTISTWISWAENFPIKEMKRRKWLTSGSVSDVDALLTFLGVSSPDSWRSVWNTAAVAYRQTRKFRTSEESISAWVRRTELEAMELDADAFDGNKLRSSINNLRAMTRQRIDETIEPLQRLCAASGVAVVFVPELSHTGISGCARWLTDNKAIVALTFRYKTDDQLWFTFFHELGHLLLHRDGHSFVLDNADSDLSDQVVDPQMRRYEDEANRFSADTLIPPDKFHAFIQKRLFTNKSIQDFSEEIGIGPGLVVGRLQFEGLLAAHQGNALKQQIEVHLAED